MTKNPEFIHTYIAYCCREWVAPLGYQGGTCGLCGEKPTFLREDPNSPILLHGPRTTPKEDLS